MNNTETFSVVFIPRRWVYNSLHNQTIGRKQRGERDPDPRAPKVQAQRERPSFCVTLSGKGIVAR